MEYGIWSMEYGDGYWNGGGWMRMRQGRKKWNDDDDDDDDNQNAAHGKKKEYPTNK